MAFEDIAAALCWLAALGSVPLPVLGTYYDWQTWGVPTYLPFTHPYFCQKAGWGRPNIPTYPLAPHSTNHTKYPAKVKGLLGT